MVGWMVGWLNGWMVGWLDGWHKTMAAIAYICKFNYCIKSNLMERRDNAIIGNTL
jgi:hypothetical protein